MLFPFDLLRGHGLVDADGFFEGKKAFFRKPDATRPESLLLDLCWNDANGCQNGLLVIDEIVFRQSFQKSFQEPVTNFGLQIGCLLVHFAQGRIFHANIEHVVLGEKIVPEVRRVLVVFPDEQFPGSC